MAFIRARGGKYQVRWKQGGGRSGREVSETFPSRAGAVKFKGLVDAAGQRYPEGWVPGYGFITTSTAPPLAEWFERALAANVRANETTKDDYRALFARHVPAWLAGRPIDAITREDAGAWIASLAAPMDSRRPLSEKSIRNVQGMVSSALNAAVYDGLVTRNVFLGVLAQRPPVHADEQVFLTREEFDLIIENTPDHPDSVAVLRLMFHTGLRVGEATVLRARDIDLDNERLHVSRAWKRGGFMGLPKSSRSRRTLAIGPAMVEVLRPRMDRGDLLFTNSQGRQLMQASVRVYTWGPAVKAAQSKGLTKQPRVHDLRHSHAAYLISSGVPLLAVSRRLGHASIQITADRYGHLLPDVDEGIRGLL